MHFEYALKTKLPIGTVYRVLRDELYKLAKYLPNVENIELLERKEDKDKIYTVNKWYAKNILPSSITQFIKFDIVAWLDYGEWNKIEYICDWSYKPYIFQDYISAKGKTLYSTDGAFTVIRFMGDVYINLDKYPFIIVVPQIMRKKISDEFLNFLSSMIETNFYALVKGLEEYIEHNDLLGKNRIE